ncbi:MAG TPA: zinc ribbon domain-containing protein [Dictyobacter sp.]|nr:zinc ribbon domain-containing protein [Dictyobacter sp.]
MVTCPNCGGDVTGKKFCSSCGMRAEFASMQPTLRDECPRCQGTITPGASFCMHCGTALSAVTPPPPPAVGSRQCSACNSQVAVSSVFCTNCGHDMRQTAPAYSSSSPCPQCGHANAPATHYCGGCGYQLVQSAQGSYGSAPSGQYAQQYQQPQYAQGQYQQSGYNQPPYATPMNGYQQQPMIGQQPMVLRCPTCMAMAPVGTAQCVSCHTSLAGVVPMAANMPAQGQQGGFLNGNAGKFAMGALGGAAAVIGGEMLLNGVENSIEDRVEGDMGFGERRHHHRHHREEGLLGPLGNLVDDLGL